MANQMFHATVLNLHQPPNNIEHLLDHAEWEAKEILYALDRIPRSLWGQEDLARVHLSLSGTLMETLTSPEFQRRVYGIVKCGDLLWHLRNPAIEVLGTAYYHPVLPLIPPEDWDEQIVRWLRCASHLFDGQAFQGFWPPEMGFCMEMIPALKRHGFRYVLVDSEHVEPVEPMRWEEVRYRPHIARYGGDEIIIVVRDRELSNSQEAGMDPGWFYHEICERTKWCDFPALITTCSDGDNGGWFRNTNEKANYWGGFYLPLLDSIRKKEMDFKPVFIREYLDWFGAHGEVRVREGAWNTGWHHGVGFVQWTGSGEQKAALNRLHNVSQYFHNAQDRAKKEDAPNEVLHCLAEAHWRLLRAETSCNFYWGSDWVQRAHDDMDDAEEWMRHAQIAMR